MKKHLTRQDIDKLSPEDRVPLRKLPGLWRCDDIPLMDISDMHEYLGSDAFHARRDAFPALEDYIEPPKEILDDFYENLCDILWSAVQEKAKSVQ